MGFSERSQAIVGRLCELVDAEGHAKPFIVRDLDGWMVALWEGVEMGSCPDTCEPGGIEAAATAQARYLAAHSERLHSGGRLLKLVMTPT